MKAIEAKIVVLGSQGVGKSSLIKQYICEMNASDIAPTIGASFSTFKVKLEEGKVKMQIWDTAGQEKFRAMTPMYYRNANAALLVFDLTNYNSFVEVKGWIQELHKNVIEPMILTVVGNKVDLEKARAVSREEAFLYASSINGSYYETSAINGGRGIEQVFISTARGLLRLAENSDCSSIKRYESNDSILSCNDLNGFYDKTNLSSVNAGIPVDLNVEANDTGRLETAPWSINHIAHGDAHRSSWCCY
ncbi:vacuolar protein sorting-associated protein 21 [Contarinia nasturtii]|uniref:vacuolar protein sorting-associated protein 21 n=1 Tax=Contarinia nasturtii TaxID=265458 RepID=UPI0012D4A12E|nr:vacuolar protein sorting-associated protein 21 [Contarinia nasturtii]